jgi:hypothetical protein
VSSPCPNPVLSSLLFCFSCSSTALKTAWWMHIFFRLFWQKLHKKLKGYLCVFSKNSEGVTLLLQICFYLFWQDWKGWGYLIQFVGVGVQTVSWSEMLLVLLSTRALRSSCPLSCNGTNKLVELRVCQNRTQEDQGQKHHLCLHFSAAKRLGEQSFVVCFQLIMTNACFQWRART